MTRFASQSAARCAERAGKESGTERALRDEGRAIIEVVFAAVLILIPTVYILIGLLALQNTTVGVNQAARDVGRYFETADLPSPQTALDIAGVVLQDHSVDPQNLRIKPIRVGGSCVDDSEVSIDFGPGTEFDVCVIVSVSLPGVPTVLTGTRNTVSGVYRVRIG